MALNFKLHKIFLIYKSVSLKAKSFGVFFLHVEKTKNMGHTVVE